MIEQHPAKLYAMVWLTLVVGMILTIMPLPGWVVWLRPQWMLLIVLFWAMETRGKIGVGTAWLAGLLMDLLTGTLLGQHALVMTVLTYIVIKACSRFRYFPLYQQSVIIFIVALLDLLFNRWVFVLMQQSVSGWLYWLPALTSALLWPLLFDLLHQKQRYSLDFH